MSSSQNETKARFRGGLTNGNRKGGEPGGQHVAFPENIKRFFFSRPNNKLSLRWKS
jgi:hypothetical protein